MLQTDNRPGAPPAAPRKAHSHVRTWLSRTALRRGAVLVALALASVTGCASAGSLHDSGQARPVAQHPSPQPLWPAADTSPLPTPEATTDQPPPSPLPGITVPGGDIRTVDARTVLDKDPDLSKDERAALIGRCRGCVVRPAQYRDLGGEGGDGGLELITAVVAGSEAAYLRVYTLRNGRLFPALSQRVLPSFTAETVGRNLVVHEPSGRESSTSTTYGWKSVRLVTVDRQITGPGPTPEATDCEPAAAVPTPGWKSRPEPQVSAVPSARASAPARSKS